MVTRIRRTAIGLHRRRHQRDVSAAARKSFQTLLLLLGLLPLVAGNAAVGNIVKFHPNSKNSEDEGSATPAAKAVWDNRPVCPTGIARTYEINTLTGEWSIVGDMDPLLEQQQLQDDYVDDAGFLAFHNETDVYYTDIDDMNNISSSSSEIANLPPQRMLRSSSSSSSADPFQGLGLEEVSNPLLSGTTTARRRLSLDGSNSLSTSHSGSGNLDSNNDNIIRVVARPCVCFEAQDDTNSNNNGRYKGTKDIVIDDTREALCPAISDWCYVEKEPVVAARCFRIGKHDTIAKNMWPLLWMWYLAIFAAIGCTFQGRVVLDFIRGTILYYFCGCGDRFRNRSARNVDRYNHWIVDEILEEENRDRDTVLRMRNNGSVQARRMDAVTNNPGVPASIDLDLAVASPSFPLGENGEDAEDDLGGGEEDDDQQQSSNGLLDRAWNAVADRCSNILWPCQTSWQRWIKYNLLLRVEWITIRDEVAFIESRQERGLPLARFEMKTRVWRAAEDDDETTKKDGGGCDCSTTSSSNSGCNICTHHSTSLEPSITQNSLDVPHCTICFTELEDGDKVGDLGCSHVFHADCLKMWVTKRNSCPLCNIPIARRKRISSEELEKDDADLRPQDDGSPATNNNNIGETPSTPQTSNVARTSSSTYHQETNPSSPYDHTRPPPQYSSPSNIQRQQQPRASSRLTHMPMTPSTAPIDTYSNYSDDLDLVTDLALEVAASNTTVNAASSPPTVVMNETPTRQATASSTAPPTNRRLPFFEEAGDGLDDGDDDDDTEVDISLPPRRIRIRASEPSRGDRPYLPPTELASTVNGEAAAATEQEPPESSTTDGDRPVDALHLQRVSTRTLPEEEELEIRRTLAHDDGDSVFLTELYPTMLNRNNAAPTGEENISRDDGTIGRGSDSGAA